MVTWLIIVLLKVSLLYTFYKSVLRVNIVHESFKRPSYPTIVDHSGVVLPLDIKN